MRNTFFFCLIYMGLLIPAKAQHYTTLNLEQQLPTEDGWWRLFSDPTLDSLIRKATRNNYNLQNTLRNIDIAKKRTRVQQSAWFPELSATASYSPEKNSLGIEHINERNYTGQAQLEMNWEIDVFGSIRKNVKSQKEYYYASKENYRAALVSLTAQLASSYINLRNYQAKWQVARQNLESQKRFSI